MPEITLDPETVCTTPVGRLAAEYPASTKVFTRYNLDYCCGGGRMLRDACQRKGIDVTQVAEEILAELEEVGASGVDWLEAPPFLS